jgi:hypothetical protein
MNTFLFGDMVVEGAFIAVLEEIYATEVLGKVGIASTFMDDDEDG